MVSGGINRVVGQIRRAAAAEAYAGLSDGDLLGRYVAQSEETAFELIVRRHGPLVLGVCRRILGDAHAADDAFQATFLVLARKARTIRSYQSVASWLHGVARRVASRARESGRTRRWYERRWRRSVSTDTLHEVVWHDVGAILDEEIQRLPDRVRAPFVLCYLEGATNDAAARALGCPLGTVLSRLSKLRGLLRARLTRRGLALSAGFLAASNCEAAVRVPLALSEAAFRTAVGASAMTPPAVAVLAAGLLRPVWQLAGLPGSAIAIAVTCAVMSLAHGHHTAGEVPPAPPAAIAEIPATDLERLQGTWAATASVFEGQAEPAETIRGARATFVGDSMTMSGPLGQPQKMTIVLDSNASPKTFDMTPVDGPGRGLTNRGIYQFDGEFLQICFPAVVSRMTIGFGPRREAVPSPTVRPADFTASRGSLRRLFTLKRVTPQS